MKDVDMHTGVHGLFEFESNGLTFLNLYLRPNQFID